MRASWSYRLLRPLRVKLRARDSFAHGMSLLMLLAGAVALSTMAATTLTVACFSRRAHLEPALLLAAATLALPLSMAVGGLCGWLLRQRERKLWRHRETLEKQLAHLREINRQLTVAKEAAEGTSRAQSAFLAHLSQEIRTPMNGVVGMTDRLLETPLTAEQREDLSTVKLSAGSVLAIVNDVLDFSQLEAGRFELNPCEFDVDNLVGETLKSFAYDAQQKGLELAYEVQPSVPDLLVGDAPRLRQVLLNLVSNAIKFTEHGEVVVTVATAPDHGSNMIHVVVRDTGIGIAADKRREIFEAFSRADASPRRRRSGSGLGLAISARIIGLMRGEMWVESELDRGSEFHFLVPLPAGTVAKSAAAIWLAGLHTLVVDDSLTTRRILQAGLEQWGMVAGFADSGESALAAMAAAADSGHPYQLVLIDSGMLGMDGFQLAAAIQRNARLASARLIMLTTAGSKRFGRHRALEPAGFLMKPVRRSDLRALLTRLYLADAPPALAASPAVEARPSRPLCLLAAEDSRAPRDPRPPRALLEAAAPPSQPPVMDMERAFEHAGGDSVLLGEFCAIFLRESPRLLEALLHAIQHENVEAMRRQAHQLKNSVAPIGGIQVHARALSIENGAAAGSLHDLRQASAPLKRELRELRKAVKSFLSAAAPAGPVALPVPPSVGPFLLTRNRGRGAA